LIALALAVVVAWPSIAAAQDAAPTTPSEPNAIESSAGTTPASATETPDSAAPAALSYESLIAQLPTAGYADKQAIAEQLTQMARPSTLTLLRAFLDDRLRQRDSDGRIFIVEDAGDGSFKLSDAVTLEPAGTANDDALSRIRTNNGLRKHLKGLIARLQLGDADPAVRLAAVDEMMRTLDDEAVTTLREYRGKESDHHVAQLMDTALAIADLKSEDAATRLKAVEQIAGSQRPEVYAALSQLTDQDASETDPQVQAAARKALRHIDQWRRIYGWIETLFFGLSLGSVLVLAAIGLAITFGVMGVINMAHGELIMLGAYTAYVMQLLLPDHLTAALWLSIPAAFCVSGLIGVVIERGIVRFLYGRPLETLLATFGLSLILQQAVRSIFSPLNRSVASPPFMSGTLQITDALSLTANRVYIVLFMLLVFLALQLVLNRTSLGLQVRAVSQNRRMAKAMGIRSEWVDAATFGLGSGIAGVAGVALSQLTNVGPNLGQSYIIDSFMVVVFGGVGNLWGTLISGMTLGIVNKLLEPWSGAVLAKILVLVALILFIQRKPRGLFPQKGRAAEGH